LFDLQLCFLTSQIGERFTSYSTKLAAKEPLTKSEILKRENVRDMGAMT